MMGAMSISHWIIVIAAITVIFGRNKISGLLGDVGKGMRDFRKTMTEAETAKLEGQDDVR
jgi:sec-independent protein translocase protein TatA